MTANVSAILIVGIGNSYRSDDGVGIEVADRLQGRLPAGVRVVRESGEGAALLEAWQGATAVMLVDAVCAGGQPGAIYCLDPGAGQIPRSFFRSSTHAFGIAEAIELARALDRLPPRLILYGVEGQNFAPGVGLSAAVQRAVDLVVARMLDDVRALTIEMAVAKIQDC